MEDLFLDLLAVQYLDADWFILHASACAGRLHDDLFTVLSRFGGACLHRRG